MQSIFSGFFAGVSAAMVLKLASSIDDVLWLSVFLTPAISRRERASNALTYSLICFFQTCLAYVISNLGETAVEKFLSGTNMSTDRILTLIAGSVLSIYSIYLGLEYYRENYAVDKSEQYDIVHSESDQGSDSDASHSDDFQDGFEEESKHSKQPGITPFEVEVGAWISDVKAITVQPKNNHFTDSGDRNGHSGKHSRSLAVIAFLGSLDDLTLFVPMLAGKSFNILELIIGAMISTFFIVVICLCLIRCKFVADVLDRVPLVAIVAVFAVVLIIKGVRIS